MSFLISDNTAPVHPAILQALTDANHGHVRPYGNDDGMAVLTEKFRAVFDHPTLEVFPVFSGSAANCLALGSMAGASDAVICHHQSHIENDECGMPEFFTRAKLLGVGGDHGKIDLDQVEHHIQRARDFGIHHVRPTAISITQSTEAGTIYTPDELAAIAGLARRHGLFVHVDGARFANAVAALNITPAAASWQAGVDVLSFGATKNGAMMAEAVVFFNPALAKGFGHRRKRAGQLASKHRYLAVQLLAMLADDLWLNNARHANTMARRLYDGLTQAGIECVFPPRVNAIFARFTPEQATALQAKGHGFYPWNMLGPDVYRLITSFCTSMDEVDDFIRDCQRR